MIAGSAATAFTARRFKALNKRFSLSLNQETTLFLSFGGEAPPLTSPSVSDKTIVEMIKLTAVSIAAIVIPYSLEQSP